MKKLKINIEELTKDLDKVFNMLDNIDLKKLNDKDIANITNKANTLKKHITEKYVKNLDIKKQINI